MYEANYPYKPAAKAPKRETFTEILAGCLFLYGMGLTMFLFGLRQAGVL